MVWKATDGVNQRKGGGVSELEERLKKCLKDLVTLIEDMSWDEEYLASEEVFKKARALLREIT